MKMNIRKLVAALVGIGVTLTSLVGVAPATAATNEVTIKLVSPVLDATNTSEPVENQALANQWVANGWFGKGLIYQRAWLPTGSIGAPLKRCAGAALYSPSGRCRSGAR